MFFFIFFILKFLYTFAYKYNKYDFDNNGKLFRF